MRAAGSPRFHLALALAPVSPFIRTVGRNGRMIAFGPDGALYTGRGDEGGGGDPDNRGPNPRDLLCKILRLDVNRSRSEPAINGRYIYGDYCSREVFVALLEAEAHPRVIEGPQVLLVVRLSNLVFGEEKRESSTWWIIARRLSPRSESLWKSWVRVL